MKLNPRIFVPVLAIAAGLTFSPSRVFAQRCSVEHRNSVSGLHETRAGQNR